MKKRLLIPILTALTIRLLAADTMEIRRYGLFIGANQGGRSRQTLLYADDDAEAMAATMQDVGGIRPVNSKILINPSAGEILTDLKRLSREIREEESAFRRTEVMFYYSGHSDEEGLLLEEERIPYGTIREELNRSGADVVIAILDSCSSGAFTRTKGGRRRSPFLLDESSAMEGHAFLTSSSETELSQESDRIGASFFTHYLITGLRGAADNTGDGRVTLNEVYQHTYQETLSRTESTMGGPQHPAYDIQLKGTGDLVLTDLTVPTSALQLAEDLTGRFSVRDSRDKLVAEFSKQAGEVLKLALPAGAYTIRMSGPAAAAYGGSEAVKIARIDLARRSQLFVNPGDFRRDSLEATRYRGNTPPLSKRSVYVLSAAPGLDLPPLRDSDLVRAQLGLIGATAPQLAGGQLSNIFSIAEQDSLGFQISGLFNMANAGFQGYQASGMFNMIQGDGEGFQNAGTFNLIEGDLKGAQLSGVFNLNKGAMIGAQGAGLFNTAGPSSIGLQVGGLFNTAEDIKGAQAAGGFNYASRVDGGQMSVINTAGRVRGTQIGLINVADEMYGAPIGLINIYRNGIIDAGAWYEFGDEGRFYTFFQSGTEWLYTILYYGNSPDNFYAGSEDLVWGAHLGTRLSLGPLHIDLDAGTKESLEDNKNKRNSPVVSARAVAAIKGLGLFGGITADFAYPGADESVLYQGEVLRWNWDGEFRAYYRWILGFRI